MSTPISRWRRPSRRRGLTGRLLRGAMWAAFGLAVVLAAAAELMLLVLWPWPSLVVTLVAGGFVAGAAAAHLWHRIGDEWRHARTDTAIEACLDTAFELQRVTEGQPSVEQYNADDEVVMCGWCEEPAACRIDVHQVDGITVRNLPACATHRDAARYGEVTVDDVIPDEGSGHFAGWIR